MAATRCEALPTQSLPAAPERIDSRVAGFVPCQAYRHACLQHTALRNYHGCHADGRSLWWRLNAAQSDCGFVILRIRLPGCSYIFLLLRTLYLCLGVRIFLQPSHARNLKHW